MSSEYSANNIRRQNLMNVLDALSSGELRTRAQIAERLELSPASVTRAVSTLMQCGLIEEKSLVDGVGRGRRAAALQLKRDGLYTLGLHLDTLGIHYCVLDGFGMVCNKGTLPLPTQCTPEALASAAAQVLHIGDTSIPFAPGAVGVSISGRTDVRTGRVKRSDIWDRTDVDLAASFERALGKHVRIENDVKAALVWEKARLGNDAGGDMAYLYIGRAGLGFACMSGGRLMRGRSNAAGEIESVALGPDGDLSRHLLARHLIARARAVQADVADLNDILTAYKLGLAWARILIDDFFSHLHMLIDLIDSLIEPHKIILGGDTMEQLCVLSEFPKGEIFEIDRNYEESCVAGAAWIAMQDMLLSIVSELPQREWRLRHDEKACTDAERCG